MKQDLVRQEREKKILQNMGLIGFVVSHMTLEPPSGMTWEDIWQAGAVGLIRAVDAYSSDKGSFSTYACLRIRASIMDAEEEYGMPGEQEQMPVIISFDQMGEEKDLLLDSGGLERIEEKEDLAMLMTYLKGFEKQVVIGRYYDDLTLRKIAEENHLEYSKLRRIHKMAIGKLRAYYIDDV
ncbi:MAG: sigma-70 family RNA polymerase sigma factor [Firmicutes bacterium]|nr:sigma-70 family RNA polymerase sigma factor [Bacillota bacterium]